MSFRKMTSSVGRLRICQLVPVFAALMARPAIAESIDQIVERALVEQGIPAAPICSDSEFLRRVSLDLIGRIPTVTELDEFNRNPVREQKIEELLADNRFAFFWSEWMTSMLMGYRDSEATDREVMRAWLEEQIAAERPYDQIVRVMIASTGSTATDGHANFLVRNIDDAPTKVCRLFLGVRIDCARCHDHPFDRWTQDDYSRLSRFFEATDLREISEGNVQLVNDFPDAEDGEQPKFLTGAQPRTSRWRDELALHVVRSKPFARTFGNRLWYFFHGRGIVDPPDDRHAGNEPAIPKLYNHLASESRSVQFRLKPMIRQICNSRTYQRSSRQLDSHGAPAAELFAHQVLRPLMPEQLVDSTLIACDMEISAVERKRAIARRSVDGEEDYSETWKYRETTQQLLQRIAFTARFDADASLDTIFRKILSRKPTASERNVCLNKRRSEVANALIHSNEFVFNH